jgi:hypothetical protein
MIVKGVGCSKRVHVSIAAVKFEILNPKHETNPKSKFSNVQVKINQNSLVVLVI